MTPETHTRTVPEQDAQEEADMDELRRTAYAAWIGGGPSCSDLDDLALRAAAQHAQIVGNITAEREIDGLLSVREARRNAR